MKKLGKIAILNPEFLAKGRRGVLLEKARAAVVANGYPFKKGNSRSHAARNMIVNPQPRKKINSELREKKDERIRR